MRINTTELPTFSQPIVGNVYPIAGGYGRKAGHSMVLFAITEKQTALMTAAFNWKPTLAVLISRFGLAQMAQSRA